MHPLPPRSTALFGEDHAEVFEFATCALGGMTSEATSTACALSVGGNRALERKRRVEVPNEDALYAYDDGRQVVHLVADGHHGHAASHGLVEHLSELFREHGPTLDPAAALPMLHAAAEEPEPGCRARSTLAVATLDRTTRRLRGLSIGDSVIFLVDGAGQTRRLVEPTRTYAAPWDLVTLGVPPSSRFDVAVAPGDWIVTCTDGVTECHYGRPETSVQDADIAALCATAQGAPDVFVEALMATALSGVRGQPGGEDNVAIVATVV